MADPSEDDIIPGRFYGKYVCCKGIPDDEHSFISWVPKEEKRSCRKHPGKLAIREEYRPLRKKDIPNDFRLFGRFKCSTCRHEWGSANSWKGYYQQCKTPECTRKTCKCENPPEDECDKEECTNKVHTWDFYLLRRNGGENNKNGHLIADCEKCQELKRKGISNDCLTYKGKGDAASRPGSRHGSRHGSRRGSTVGR